MMRDPRKSDFAGRCYVAGQKSLAKRWEPNEADVAYLPATKENVMDKDRLKGAAKTAKGSVKDMAGKATGDKETQIKGKTEKAAGKTQSTLGKAKDKVRKAAR